MDNNLFLFRHALATKSVTGYGDRILTAEILPEGIPAVKRIGNYLKEVTDRICYSSNIIRCRQTSAIIAKIIKEEFTTDDRINEFYGESFSDFNLRVVSFLKEITKYQAKNILICTHGMVIAAVKHYVLEGEFKLEDQIDYPLTGELLIVRKNKELQKISFN